MKDKITTVPGYKHVVIQALLGFYIVLSCPRGVQVQVEKEVKIGEFRFDVRAKYYTNRGRFDMVYEVQKDVNLSEFMRKMEAIGAMGEIIPLDKCPDDILLASEWVKDRIVIPDFKRRRE